MAANSLRERIIVANKTLVEAVPAVSHTERTVQQYSQLQNFAETQFPVVAVVGRIPIPVEKHTGRDGSVDLIISRLRVDFYCYLLANEEPDTAISSLMDDLWVKLYADQKRSGLVLSTEITADENYEWWAPFAAFKMTVTHRYKHGPGGI